MAGDRDTLDVAQLQFVGLDELKRAHTQRWPEQHARILEIAESFLAQRMPAGDLVVRANDGFVLVFQASGAEANAAAGRLAHGLNAYFLAEASRPPIPHVAMRNAVASVKDLAAKLGDNAFVSAIPGLAPDGAGGCDWRYQPVWDVKRETLSNWYVTPYSASARIRLPGYQFEDTAVSPGQFADVDEASLGVAEQALRQLMAQGKQALVGSSIHVASLANRKACAQLVAALDKLDPELARFRVLKIAAIPPGMPRQHLVGMIGTLRTRLPNIVLGAAWDEPDFAGLAGCDAIAIGISIPPPVSTVGSNVPRQVLYARISEAVAIAHAARKRLFVEGAITPELAERLRVLGVDNISSPQIWPPAAEPDGMLKWPAEKLVAAA
jgi:hypothetical protein